MKSKSYLLLFLLALLLVFILGVRYGQKVEKTNKAIDYVLSITPRISPTSPISPTPLTYATSESKIRCNSAPDQICKIKFTYPSYLKIKEDPTKSAVLFEPF